MEKFPYFFEKLLLRLVYYTFFQKKKHVMSRPESWRQIFNARTEESSDPIPIHGTFVHTFFNHECVPVK